MSNRYMFNATLSGFIRIDEPNQFGCTFEYSIPAETIKEMEVDREELLSWCRSKLPNATKVRDVPWGEGGPIKYQYLQKDSKSPNPAVVWVDSAGTPLDKEVLKSVREGTKVRLIVQQKPNPYADKIGTKLIVLGAEVLELHTGSIVDSGTLTPSDVAALFAAAPVAQGYKVSEPQVRVIESQAQTDSGDYDF
jgi:hypothetical protein